MRATTFAIGSSLLCGAAVWSMVTGALEASYDPASSAELQAHLAVSKMQPTSGTSTVTPEGSCPSTITQSTSQEIVSGNSFVCNNGPFVTETHYYRAFDMGTFTGGQEYDVTSVSFGIELAQSAGMGQPITVNLYANHGVPFPGGDWFSNLIGSAGAVNVLDQSLTILSVPLAATVPAGTLELVMEVTNPDGTPAGNEFVMGSNPDAETGLSYLSAVFCSVILPTPTGDLGFPDMHIVFNVNGTCPAGTPTPTPTATPTPTTTATPTPSTTSTPRPHPTPRPRPQPPPRPAPAPRP